MSQSESKSHKISVKVTYSAKKFLKLEEKKPEVAKTPAPLTQANRILPKPVLQKAEEPKKSESSMTKIEPQKVTPAKKETREDIVVPRARKKFFSSVTLWLNDFARGFKKHWISSLVVFVGAVLILVGTFIVWPQVSYISELPNILPQNTIAFVGVSIDPLNPEVRALARDVMGNAGSVDTQKMFSDLALPVNSNALKGIDIKKMMSKEVGYATFPADDGMAQSIILHVSKPQNAQKILEAVSAGKNLEQKSYKNETVFTIRDKEDATKAFSYVYIRKFVVITSGVTAPFTFVDVAKGDKPAFSKLEDYTKLADKQKTIAAARGYLDSSKIAQLSLPESLKQFTKSSPYLTDGRALIVSAFEKDGALSIQTMFARKKVDIQSVKNLNLTASLPLTSIASFQGQDFSVDWQNAETSLKNSQPLLGFYFSNIEKRLQDSFQFNISSDFLRYFENAYVIALDTTTSRSKNTGKPFQNTSVVLKLKDAKLFEEGQVQLEDKVKKILSSQFQNEPVNLTQESYANLTLSVLSGEALPFNVYYVVHDDALYVSTTKSFFDNISDAASGALSSQDAYEKLSSLGLNGALHASFLDLSKLAPVASLGAVAKIFDGALVLDAQKGDNAVVTAYFHFVANK